MMSVKPVGLHLHQQVADPRAFELEDALGLAPLKQLEGLASSSGRVSRSNGAAILRSISRTAVDRRRQVAQAEEVHLEQAGLLDVPHLPLGADDLFILVLVRGASAKAPASRAAGRR